jgi:hypothetical protein
MTTSQPHLPFHESDPDRWWEQASGPVRALYEVLRATPPGARPALPPLDDPATAPDTAAACAAAALSRLAESIAEVPDAARLRIDGGPW